MRTSLLSFLTIQAITVSVKLVQKESCYGSSGQSLLPTKKLWRTPRPALAQAWRSFIDYNPRKGVLVAATQLGEVLEIYNLKDSTHVVCIGPHGEPEFQVAEGYGIPTGIMGFGDVQVTDNAIYAVFQGKKLQGYYGERQAGKTNYRMADNLFMCLV